MMLAEWGFRIVMITLVTVICAMIGSAVYDSSERKELIRAYNKCLETMSRHDIMTIETFCNKLKERL